MRDLTINQKAPMILGVDIQNIENFSFWFCGWDKYEGLGSDYWFNAHAFVIIGEISKKDRETMKGYNMPILEIDPYKRKEREEFRKKLMECISQAH